jgi:hypothetical protein
VIIKAMGTESIPLSDQRLESCADFAAPKIEISACFRTSKSMVLAGGPVEVTFHVTNKAATTFFLASGRSRTKLRPAFFSFTARLNLDGAEVQMNDPTVAIIERGGPVGQIEVAANSAYGETLLLNEFVSLEKTVPALRPGQVGVLEIYCQRPLPMAGTPAGEAYRMNDAPVLNSELVINVRRDDAALEGVISRLARGIRADDAARVSAQREQMAAKLASLRSPMALPYLQSLTDHPDPVVRLYVARAMTFLNEQSSN